jgi:WD40-like Beta Propeller Repeat
MHRSPRALAARIIGGAAAVVAALSPATPVDSAAATLENGAIAFAGKRLGKPVIYMRDPDLTGPRVVPTRGWAGEPAVSPGGQRIVFTRRGRLGSQIWTAYTDGSALTQLTSGPTDFAPRWSPAGDAVVFARGPVGSGDIYRIRSDGTGLLRLTLASSDDRSPAWSVRERIAFVRSRGAGGDIYDIAASAGRPRRLTRGPADDRAPAWSPTGTRLAFARGRPGRRDLHLVSADGAGRRRLTALPGDESEPAWSPDGHWLAFTHRRAGGRRLYRLRIGPRAVSELDSRRLRPLGSSRAEPRSPHWQPAGVDPVIAAAGDIACDPADPRFAGGVGTGAFCHQRQTSDLLLRMDLAGILAPGDLQYEDATLWKFQQSFDPTWGRLKPLIRPAPGNHEYEDPGATGYFDYFNGPDQESGPAGRRDEGYYGFDVGAWHLVALNSECGRVGGCAAESPQEGWLRADLAAHFMPRNGGVRGRRQRLPVTLAFVEKQVPRPRRPRPIACGTRSGTSRPDSAEYHPASWPCGQASRPRKRKYADARPARRGNALLRQTGSTAGPVVRGDPTPQGDGRATRCSWLLGDLACAGGGWPAGVGRAQPWWRAGEAASLAWRRRAAAPSEARSNSSSRATLSARPP